jgi:flagella basal body P-ring formation protein FlgA
MRFCLIVLCFVLNLAVAEARYILTLGLEDISKAVAKEFAEQGIEENIELEIFGGKTAFVLENAENAKIMMSNMKIDEEQNRFEAKAEIFADGKLVDTTELVGRYYLVQKIWVPIRDIAKDELIKEEDLGLQDQRANRIKKESLIAKSDLIGKQALKLLKADKAVAKDDVCDEIIVKKGESVTVIYQHKGLQITAKMQALESGSKGQSIKVLNNKSDKEIVAKVVDKHVVEIEAE